MYVKIFLYSQTVYSKPVLISVCNATSYPSTKELHALSINADSLPGELWQDEAISSLHTKEPHKSGTIFTKLHFLRNLKMGPIS